MVRNVKPISEVIEAEIQPRRRHLVSQPPDNIGVNVAQCSNSLTTIANNSTERIIAGRRRSLSVPRDNIGVACLPTAERLGNITEVPEYESSDEEADKKPIKPSQNQKATLPHAKPRARARMNFARDDGAVRSMTSSSTDSDTMPNRNIRYERSRSCKRSDTVGLLWQQSNKEPQKRTGELTKAEHKFQLEMGISNVRRPRDDPSKPRKPIMPRDNIGFACRPLHKSTGRLSGPRLSTGVNLKSSSNGVERRNILQGKPPTVTRYEKITGEQIKTLRAVSKLSVLLLYIHFLLTYYLSFSKNNRYGEIFDSCPPQDVHE